MTEISKKPAHPKKTAHSEMTDHSDMTDGSVISETTAGSDNAEITEQTNANDKPRRAAPSEAAMMGRVATIVLLLLFALVAVVVWIA
ncbi:hypothetical protein [Pseudooceanicola aestuarii]|uniref:hypothetical protein n=1 Tax=Pseudooceanicola aestuarii TaxID=2697319 RepID=UPI0013D40520|nr:hypothetical protein [Pseudooceanicola aestuarii]